MRDLYGRFGSRGIHWIEGILRIRTLSVFCVEAEFDSN